MTNQRLKFGRTALVSVLALIATAAISMVSVAQTRQQPQIKTPAPRAPEAMQTAPVLVDATEDYKIGPRDVIEIKVDDADELSKSYEIGADGTFLLNYVGRVAATGKTSDQLARMIEDGLREKYLKNPHVTVVVKQFNSHTFVIQGMVNRPGVYQVESRPSVFKLISIAGGLADGHGSTAFVFRELRKRPGNTASAGTESPTNGDTAEEGDYTVTPINIAGFQRGKLHGNIFLEPGDTVSVPKADIFYVAGEVNAPGSFPLSDGMTVRQALALSQGTTSNAKAG
jgi:polysaccharide export outer membrane protein